MKKITNKNSGFTLIELLVVVAIISLLSSVILASVKTAREKAEGASSVQEMRQFQIAVQMFINENGRYPDPGTSGMYCLSGNGNCVFAGSTSGFSNIGGELALIIEPQNNTFAHTLIKKAEALISSKIPGYLKINPTVSGTGGTYAGPIYIWDDVDKTADILITAKTEPTNFSSYRTFTGQTGIYTQAANGGTRITSY